MSPAKDSARTAGISSEAVEKATGRSWDAWLKVLDRDGAKAMSHKQIAELLHTKHEVAPWWSQMVTVGYEQARGLREANQKADGYTVSASRVLGVPLSQLYDAWKSARKRGQWLSESGMVIRKATADKSMRITWIDGKSSVDVYFYAKTPQRSQVSVQHSRLAAKADVDRLRKFWSARLDALKLTLTGEEAGTGKPKSRTGPARSTSEVPARRTPPRTRTSAAKGKPASRQPRKAAAPRAKAGGARKRTK